VDEFTFRRGLYNILENRNFHRIFITLLFIYYGVVYYFGEIVDLTGWEALRWDFFYGVHDVHRLFFLIPIVYTGYIFRVKWALIITFFSFLVFLPRALIISPFADPSLRMVLFTVIAGLVGALTGMVRNESEHRRKLESLVRNERDKLRDILESMEDGVLIIGPDYKIRFTNQSIVKELGDGIGTTCHEYLYHRNTPCENICELKVEKGEPFRRSEYSSGDGKVFDVITLPYTDTDGQICQLATFRNITRRKQVENELIELSQLKSDLLSNVSHELKSPLTSIKGIVSSLLQKDIKLDEDTSEMLLTGISEETDRLINLVTNLLDMSRLEAGIWKPKKEYCYITDIISEALERQKWAGKKNRYETSLEPDLPQIYADYNQIKQVLTNLLENAAAYSEEGMPISIAAKVVDAMIEVSVSDSGAGIPQGDLEKVFDKFYRGNQNRQQPGGTGLGLAICRSIINSHGGEIWAERNPGRGSTFRFRLPIAMPDGI
jgi:signal transduction histidine kinase